MLRPLCNAVAAASVGQSLSDAVVVVAAVVVVVLVLVWTMELLYYGELSVGLSVGRSVAGLLSCWVGRWRRL